VKWLPNAESIQMAACAKEGVTASIEGITNGYTIANMFMDAANSERPISTRTTLQRKAFFTKYEQLLLKAAGANVSTILARRIWEHVESTPKELAVYDDAIPALQELKSRDLTLGIISNIGPVLGEMIVALGLIEYIDLWVSSGEVGVTKPHAAIFQAALKKSKALSHEAIHIGDSYESDVLGATNAGIDAILLIREGTVPDMPVTKCPIIYALTEIPSYLTQSKDVQ
jgi:HAD superfamily hydrolase (TIGR01549 family)